jgi:hypothetical protein
MKKLEDLEGSKPIPPAQGSSIRQPVLSQLEVDALLKAVSGGPSDPDLYCDDANSLFIDDEPTTYVRVTYEKSAILADKYVFISIKKNDDGAYIPEVNVLVKTNWADESKEARVMINTINIELEMDKNLLSLNDARNIWKELKKLKWMELE